MTNPFQYDLLDPRKRQIRVLHIKPGQHGTQIHATLAVKSLDQEGQTSNFEAVSYMWGDQSLGSSSQMILNDHMHFGLSQRLGNVLDCLRQTNDPVTVWIDAICINQQDEDEKNHQVPMMRAIYQSAKIVRIWLDHDIHPQSEAFISLHTIGIGSILADIGDEPDFWDPVREIFLDPYWGRVWIQQEISNASVLSIHCRHVQIQTRCVYHFLRLFEEIMTDQIMKAKWWDWNVKKPSITLPDRFGCQDDSERVSTGSTLDRENLDVLGVLSKSQRLRCTNERDRVYGLLHLAADYNEGEIPVDYRSSISQVYAQVPAYIIRKYRSLRFLLFASCHPATDPPTPASDLFPTWVPDWRRQTARMLLPATLSSFTKRIDTETSKDIAATIINNGNILSVNGTKIGQISRFYKDLFEGDILSYSVSGFVEICLSMRNDATSSGLGNPESKTDCIDAKIMQSTQALLASSQWQSLVRTLSGVDNRPLHELDANIPILYKSAHQLVDLAGFEREGKLLLGQLLNAGSSLPESTGIAAAFIQFAWWNLLTHMPFLSADGSFGLAYQFANVGDEIWRINGCDRLVTLRPQSQTNIHQTKCYTVLGEAYLDGANFGGSVMQTHAHNMTLETVDSGQDDVLECIWLI